MKKSKWVITVVICLLVACAIFAFVKMRSSSIKTIYRIAAEWQSRNTLPAYHENKEIVGDYDKSLAVKCENGIFVGKREENGTLSWKGIPFGTIPARFERAVNPAPSDKVYEAYYYGKSVLQPQDPEGQEMASLYEQGDLDCLTLVVHSGISSKKRKPVLVYIHGGGWVFGGTSDPAYNGSNFVYYNPDIIVVNITYRVGILGQINLGAMKDGEYLLKDYKEKESVFNTAIANGILDQIQALRWIKKNIAAFGGDPDNITICGESAGGCSVSTLVMMASDPNNKYFPKEEKLFTRAISMSGGFNQYVPLKSSERLTKKIASDFKISSIEQLQKLDFETLKKWWNNPENQQLLNFCVRGTVVLPEDPYAVYSQNVGDNFTVLQGATTNEFAYYREALRGKLKAADRTFEQFCDALHTICTGPSVIYPNFMPSNEFKDAYMNYMVSLSNQSYLERLLSFCNDYTLQGINYYMAEKQAQNGGTCYTYAFDQPYDGPLSSLKAAHSVDCFYLFGNFDGLCGAGTKEEVDLSIKFQKMIAQFCRTGNPSLKDLTWKPYNKADRNCMFINAKVIKLIEKFNYDRIENLVKMFDTNEYFRYIISWADAFKQMLSK